MVNKLKLVYKDWKTYNTSDTFFEEHEEEIDKTNLHVLRTISLIVTLIMFFTWMSPILYTHRIMSAIVYGVILLVSLAIALISRYYVAKNAISHAAVSRLICWFVLITGLLTTYIGAIATPDMLSTWFQVYIICAACMFIITPIQYFKFTTAFEVIFIVCTYTFKSNDIALYDLTNSLATYVLAIIVQWEITRTRVKELLAKAELRETNEKFYRLYNTDDLTGVASRRSIMKTLDEYMICCHEGLFHLGGIIFDVDYFKEYNDTYGHQQGDEALQQAIGAVKKFCDSNDIKLGRVGGEEFLAVWMCDDISNAYMIAEDIRSAVEDQQIFHQKSSASPFVTISVGAYIAEKGAVISAKEFYARTDKCLYTAKEEGRNRVCLR